MHAGTIRGVQSGNDRRQLPVCAWALTTNRTPVPRRSTSACSASSSGRPTTMTSATPPSRSVVDEMSDKGRAVRTRGQQSLWPAHPARLAGGEDHSRNHMAILESETCAGRRSPSHQPGHTGIRVEPLTDSDFLTSTVELPTLAAFSSSACAGSPSGAALARWIGRSSALPAVRGPRPPGPTFPALSLSGSSGCPGCRSSEDTGYADRDHRTPVD